MSNYLDEQWEDKKEDFVPSVTTIPAITFQDNARLATNRSQSFELPRDKQQGGAHAHFDNSSSIGRPGMNKTSLSHSDGYSLSRPSAQSRKSFARSVSSFSVYSNFAGERFNNSDKKRKNDRKLSQEFIENEKKNKTGFSDNFSMEENGSNKAFGNSDDDNGTPKASVGKAMFMFLKAFIGSGVLFLPKA